MAFVNMNDALKAVLFDDEDAADRLRVAGMSGRRMARLRGPNRSRCSRRTDFARPGRFRFFSRGRSYPTNTLAVGYPDVIRYVVGMQVGLGTVVAIDIPRGMLWVTP